MSRIVGIDFGTSSTQVSFRNAGGTSTLVSFDVQPQGTDGGAAVKSFSIPTLVAQSADGQLSYGFDVTLPTISHGIDNLNDHEIIYSIKSQILEAVSLEAPKAHPSFERIVGFLGYVGKLIQSADPSLSPLNEDVLVQMSCPVMWNLAARTFLVDAATAAGYRVRERELLDEPISAAGAWVREKGSSITSGKALLFDMGAGTLDLALISLEDAETRITAATGNNIAGDYIDDLLMEILSPQFTEVLGSEDWRDNSIVLEGLRNETRLAKESLSRSGQSEYTFESAPIKVKLKDLEAALTRPKTNAGNSEQGNFGFTAAAVREIEGLLRQAKMHEKTQALTPAEIRAIDFQDLRDEIDYVVLVGGSTEMWGVRTFIEALFPLAKGVQFGSVDPELRTDAPRLTVALGLAQSENPVSLNDFRPNYSVRFYWEGAPEGITIYEAYSPPFDFEDEWLLSNRVFAKRPWLANVPDLQLPTAPTSSNPGGIVAFIKPNGQLIHSDLGDGGALSGFFFAFGQFCSPNRPDSQAAQVRFTSNQEVVITDGQGHKRRILVKHGLRKDSGKYVMNVHAENTEEIPDSLIEFWSSLWLNAPRIEIESPGIGEQPQRHTENEFQSSDKAPAEHLPPPPEVLPTTPALTEVAIDRDLSRAGALWTLDEDQILANAYVNGEDWSSIASQLARTEKAVIARAVMFCKEQLRLALSPKYVFEEIELEETQGLETFLRAGLKIEQIALALSLSQEQVFTFGFQMRLLKPIDPKELEHFTTQAELPSRHGAAWTLEEIDTLKRQVNDGLTLADIAAHHQRTTVSIFMKVHSLGGLNEGQLELCFANAHFGNRQDLPL